MTGFDIFANSHRPDRDLLFSRGDPNDPRLGEVVHTDPADYPGASVVLLGCPQDEGVRRNKGRPGAEHAPTEIRRAFYRLSVSSLTEHPEFSLFDLGDVIISGNLEHIHDLHRQIVRHVIADGKRLIVLGGGNDISYPSCAGLADVMHDVLAFNVDDHLDVRADTPRNSGTPYRLLLEEGYLQPHRFYEMGYQPFSNSPVYVDYLRQRGVTAYTLRQLRREGIPRLFEAVLAQHDVPAIFWGIDMDSVRATDAPGVSAANPIGLNAEELCEIAFTAGNDVRSRVLEITEVNPVYDIDGHTSKLAAIVIFYYLFSLFTRKDTR